LKTELTTGIGTRRVGGIFSSARSFALRTRIAVRDRMDVRAKLASANSSPSVQERQQELIKFYEFYEEFVELLCDAAQYGPTPSLDSNYDRLRASIVEGYAPLRPFVAAFLPPEESDAFRFESGRPRDAFERLFAAHRLQEFLHHDDGEMIFRIMKTREALNRYGEHLRQLASRTA
jgi:hypothetical protein